MILHKQNVLSPLECYRVAEVLYRQKGDTAAEFAKGKAESALTDDDLEYAATWETIHQEAKRIELDAKRGVQSAVGIRPLPDPERFRVRSEIINQGTRALVLVNGGGAIALITFLQFVWDRKPLAQAVLLGILLLGLGLAFSLLTSLLRYWTSLKDQRGEPWALWSAVQRVVWAFSITLFILALVVLFVGGWSAQNPSMTDPG